jgi:glutamate-1-semialdehyde 2,1-aminomutase
MGTNVALGTDAAADESGAQLAKLIAAQEAEFFSRQTRSAEMHERAVEHLAGGATSNWMISRPATIWVSHGKGSRIFDVDGHDYVDLHAGYGAMAVGHANPAIVKAVSERVALGTHFAQPTDDAIVVANELADRFGLPLWRFTNSGTEATMDAIHLMRAITGRDRIIKIEGSYHGHHDSVMISAFVDLDVIGSVEQPASVPATGGLPKAITDLCVIVPFNNLGALEKVLDRYEGEIAGMIVEPLMMNAGIIPPEPGYLEGVRGLTREHGVLLAYDEVKTGLTVGPGGATKLLGVAPDIVCLAKALGGGVPCGAVGGTAEVMSAITDGRYEQVGTFNGNPLTMAAARATLTEVLTPEAYAEVERLGQAMLDGSLAALERHGVPAHGYSYAMKGCVVLHPTPVSDYRGFLDVHTDLSHLHWLYQHNGGVFLPPWGKGEQWTISVQHTDEDVARFVGNVERFAEAVGQLDLAALRETGSYA